MLLTEEHEAVAVTEFLSPVPGDVAPRHVIHAASRRAGR
jgi:hypothetical protein